MEFTGSANEDRDPPFARGIEEDGSYINLVNRNGAGAGGAERDPPLHAEGRGSRIQGSAALEVFAVDGSRDVAGAEGQAEYGDVGDACLK